MTDQLDKLKLFREQMNKDFKKKGLKPLVNASEIIKTPPQTSGILSLDVALGGGWATNKWIEVVGESSASKTTSILRTIAVNQEMNPDYSVYWVASEGYNPDWAKANGVDNSRVEVLEHNNMELCFQSMLDAGKSDAFDCIVLDSYPALIASDEEEKDMNGFTVGGGARRVGQFFRKVPDTYSLERPYVGFFVNQYRDKVGVFSAYGTPKTEPGGKAKNYQFWQRVKVARDKFISEKRDGVAGTVDVGQIVKFEVVKNKQGAPNRTAAVDMYFDFSEKGFGPGDYDKIKDICTMGVMYGVIIRGGGGWISYVNLDGEELKWRSLDVLADHLRGNIELQEEITKLTLDVATAKD